MKLAEKRMYSQVGLIEAILDYETKREYVPFLQEHLLNIPFRYSF